MGDALEFTIVNGRLRLAGELDAASCELLRPVIAEHRDDALVIDLREVSFIDSSGVQLLLDAHIVNRRLYVDASTIPAAAARIIDILDLRTTLTTPGV